VGFLIRIGIVAQLDGFDDVVVARIKQRDRPFQSVAQIKNVLLLIQRDGKSAAFCRDLVFNFQRGCRQLENQPGRFVFIKEGADAA